MEKTEWRDLSDDEMSSKKCFSMNDCRFFRDIDDFVKVKIDW